MKMFSEPPWQTGLQANTCITLFILYFFFLSLFIYLLKMFYICSCLCTRNVIVSNFGLF